MLIFLLKFSACLAIFMLFYKVFLERSSMHQFKRIYLLATVLMACIIPFLTITEYIEPISNTEYVVSEMLPIIDDSEIIIDESPINYVSIILWSIYGLGVFVFLLKFCHNLKTIVSRIKHHPKYKFGSIINVLLKQPIVPHTFFNYIFLNENKFEKNAIPDEVMLHEQTHAKQMHSADVFFLEILQIIFWFNPLIYLLKRDIKLNHEFLADSAVLNQGIQPSAYQELLLTFSTHSNEPQLANAINYSSIKKRFTVMKTHTSKTSIWLRSLLLLPLLAILFYSFSERVQIEKETAQSSVKNETLESKKSNSVNTEKLATNSNSEIELLINDQGELRYDDEIIAIEDLSNIYRFENDMNISLKTTLNVEKEVITSVTKRIQDFLRRQGLKTFSVCVSAENEDKQDGLTAKQLNEYNRLAKYYNSQPLNKRIIKKVEIERLKRLYNLMSDAQKEKAQPFPEVPPPPPPAPELVKTGFIEIKDQLLYFVKIGKHTSYFNKKGFKVSKEGKVMSKVQVNASDVIPGRYITKVYTGNKLFAEFKDNNPNRKDEIVDMPPPPPPSPPAPKSTLDFAIDLAKKNAKFHFEKKAISSDEAIALLKKDPELNMLAKNTKTKQPLVYISKDPISLSKKTKSDEPVKINGKTPIDDQIRLTNKEAFMFKLSLNDAKVLNFKLKVPGQPSRTISGNTLDNEGKSLLRKLPKNAVFQLFDIKDSKGSVHPPVIISIIK